MTTTTNLTTRAMLVELTISKWSASTHDQKISKEVAETHQSDQSMGHFSKQLIAKDALKELRRISNEARAEHNRRTLPWTNDGARVLSSSGYFEYSEKMRELEAEFDTAKEQFFNEYADHVESARRRLNGLYNPEEYPTLSEMRRKFAFGVNVLPMQTAQDFRVQLGDIETERIREEIEKASTKKLEAAIGDIYDRIREVVGKMAEKLRAYRVTTEGVENIFRDSLIDNVRELVAILPTLNILGDQRISDFTLRMQDELLRYHADELRASDNKREQIATAAESILKQMDDFI